MFEIEYTDEFGTWWEGLTIPQQEAVAARVDMLSQRGPSLKRPVVGEIKGSKHDPQMKELRCGQDGVLRVLFVFDPRRTAILLLGGDKTGQWKAWYREAIPQADDLYDDYINELRNQNLIE